MLGLGCLWAEYGGLCLLARLGICCEAGPYLSRGSGRTSWLLGLLGVCLSLCFIFKAFRFGMFGSSVVLVLLVEASCCGLLNLFPTSLSTSSFFQIVLLKLCLLITFFPLSIPYKSYARPQYCNQGLFVIETSEKREIFKHSFYILRHSSIMRFCQKARFSFGQLWRLDSLRVELVKHFLEASYQDGSISFSLNSYTLSVLSEVCPLTLWFSLCLFTSHSFSDRLPFLPRK